MWPFAIIVLTIVVCGAKVISQRMTQNHDWKKAVMRNSYHNDGTPVRHWSESQFTIGEPKPPITRVARGTDGNLYALEPATGYAVPGSSMCQCGYSLRQCRQMCKIDHCYCNHMGDPYA